LYPVFRNNRTMSVLM